MEGAEYRGGPGPPPPAQELPRPRGLRWGLMGDFSLPQAVSQWCAELAGADKLHLVHTELKKNYDRTVGQRVGMSASDIEQLKIMYCGASPAPGPTPEPSDCKDARGWQACNKMKSRGKCSTKGAKKKCKKTCGHC